MTASAVKVLFGDVKVGDVLEAYVTEKVISEVA